MSHQVKELKDSEENSDGNVHVLISPCGRGVLRVKEEVHVNETKDEPVVETVLEKVREGHGVIRESVYEQSFKLSLHIVTNDHSQAKLLIEDQLRLSVDLLLEYCQCS